jgi:hypothetical protein
MARAKVADIARAAADTLAVHLQAWALIVVSATRRIDPTEDRIMG